MPLSLPLWERGLKLSHYHKLYYRNLVAPFVGAWVEMTVVPLTLTRAIVAPFVGAWVEIRETCGSFGAVFVAPFVGAWAEIGANGLNVGSAGCRSLCEMGIA